MEYIMKYIKNVFVESVYVSLIVDYLVDKLYIKFGFIFMELDLGGMYIKF